MDEKLTQSPETAETPAQVPYKPRPVWQIWTARIGLVVVIGAFLLYLYQIATGGL